MNKKILLTCIISIIGLNPVLAYDMTGIPLVNPLENPANTYINLINAPQKFEVKRGTLTKNAIKNQYKIAMDKFMQSNVKASYQDFKVLIDNVVPSDYVYMRLTQEMASIGFFSLAELSITKMSDKNIVALVEDDVRNYYMPSSPLTIKDQLYLAEIYSNISYNDQSKEATSELMQQSSLLNDSDYANYLVAFGSMKNGDVKQAEKSIEIAVSKNPKNINYRRLKAEIYAQSDKPQLGLKYLNDISYDEINTVVFDKELHSSKQYILYKAAKNEYVRKYHLAYYYYDEGELNKALRVLQTAISGKKNSNKDVFALTAKVYYDMQEFEKAQDYALKTINIDPTNNEALIVLGDISMRAGNIELAQNYYKKAGDKDSLHLAEIKLGKTYEMQGNIKKAKEIYSKVLKVSSKAYEAYYNMALLEKDRQETYLKKVVAINPNFESGWISLARYEIEKDSLDAATEYLQTAKYLNENDYRYYYYQGLVYKNKGLYEQAQEFFEKSHTLNSDDVLVKKELNI